jgi:hypothetical protein
MNYAKISVYLNEAEQWQGRPLYLELLDLFKKHKVEEGVILRAVTGFPPDHISKPSLFHPSKKMPLVAQFIDGVEIVEAALSELKMMLPNHLIVRVPVEVVNGDNLK